MLRAGEGAGASIVGESDKAWVRARVRYVRFFIRARLRIRVRVRVK